MNPFSHLLDAASWSGSDGIGARLLEHLTYSGAALLVAAILAIPVGVLVGHTRRGDALIGAITNAARAVPTLGLLVLVVTLMGTGLVPVVIALAVLAIPPMLSGTVAGFQSVDPDVVTAAEAMGMTDGEAVRRVELPLALPLIVSGVRSAALQLVATATVAAMAEAGGLGRLIIDGQKRRGGYPEMISGAVCVMVLAIAIDQLMGLVAWLLRRRTHSTTGAV